MNYAKDLVHILLPLLGLSLLVIGIKNKIRNYVILSFWLSFIAVVITYQRAGGEILGYYFNYSQALIYTISIVTLLASILYFLIHLESKNLLLRYLSGFIAAVLVISALLLLINLWINAFFVENRLPGTPILQVATFKKVDYCAYRYVFYKINKDRSIHYLCPNHYGLIPSIGRLTTTPDFLLQQLPPNLGQKFSKKKIHNYQIAG